MRIEPVLLPFFGKCWITAAMRAWMRESPLSPSFTRRFHPGGQNMIEKTLFYLHRKQPPSPCHIESTLQRNCEAMVSTVLLRSIGIERSISYAAFRGDWPLKMLRQAASWLPSHRAVSATAPISSYLAVLLKNGIHRPYAHF